MSGCASPASLTFPAASLDQTPQAVRYDMSGMPLFRAFIDMQSSQGGLNQINSATFLVSMTGRATEPLRSRDVLETIEPDYRPGVHAGR